MTSGNLTARERPPPSLDPMGDDGWEPAARLAPMVPFEAGSFPVGHPPTLAAD